MSHVVTAATGHLGRGVVESLLARGVPADQVVAGGRDPSRLADLAHRGVRTVRLDYDDPGSLEQAFRGADTVLLVSGNEFGRRVRQHTAAATAAARAGVGLLAYTSAPYADITSLALAAEHRGTEQAIRALDMPFAFLRNGWYLENYTAQLPTYVQHGAVLGAAGEGRISGALRAEQAEAAAAVLATDGHQGAVYELGGDTSFTLAELAAQVALATGEPVAYRNLTVPELADAVRAAVAVPV